MYMWLKECTKPLLALKDVNYRLQNNDSRNILSRWWGTFREFILDIYLLSRRPTEDMFENYVCRLAALYVHFYFNCYVVLLVHL